MQGGEGKGQAGLTSSSLLCTEGQTSTVKGGPWEAESSLLKKTHTLLPAVYRWKIFIYIYYFLVVNITCRYKH